MGASPRPLKTKILSNSLHHLAAEHPTIPIVLELASRVTLAQILDTVERHFRYVPELRSCVVRPKLGRSYRLEQANYNFSLNVIERPLAKACYSSIRRTIASLNAKPIDMTKKAPWEIFLLQPPAECETRRCDVHGTVLLVRVDHSLTDGRGVLEIIELLAGRPPKQTPINGKGTSPPDSIRSLLTRKNLAPAIEASSNKVPDPICPIKRDGPSKDIGVGWLEKPWSIAQIRAALGRIGHGTVNDFVVAAACGALRRYLLSKDWDLSKGTIHHVVMVDLYAKFFEYREKRTRSIPASNLTPSQGNTPSSLINPMLGNYVGALIHASPLTIATPRNRFQEIYNMMQAERESKFAAARIAGKFLDVAGSLPDATIKKMMDNSGKTVSTYISNLNFNLPPLSPSSSTSPPASSPPGHASSNPNTSPTADDGASAAPSAILEIAGAKVRHVRFLGVRSGTMAIFFPVISYRDRIYVSFGYDQELFTTEDADSMTRFLQEEYDDLLTIRSTSASSPAPAVGNGLATKTVIGGVGGGTAISALSCRSLSHDDDDDDDDEHEGYGRSRIST